MSTIQRGTVVGTTVVVGLFAFANPAKAMGGITPQLTPEEAASGAVLIVPQAGKVTTTTVIPKGCTIAQQDECALQVTMDGASSTGDLTPQVTPLNGAQVGGTKTVPSASAPASSMSTATPTGPTAPADYPGWAVSDNMGVCGSLPIIGRACGIARFDVGGTVFVNGVTAWGWYSRFGQRGRTFCPVVANIAIEMIDQDCSFWNDPSPTSLYINGQKKWCAISKWGNACHTHWGHLHFDKNGNTWGVVDS